MSSTPSRKLSLAAHRRGVLAVLAVAGLASAAALALLGGASGEADRPLAGVPAADPGPIHVHALGVDPGDRSLLLATHTGLFRLPPGARKAARVSDLRQDTMGFTIVGPGRYLGSGHPDARDRLPPLLGLISSADAGRSWRPVALLGEADFHVLRAAGPTLYGVDSSSGRLLASSDAGTSWSRVAEPGQILDLVPRPDEPQRLVATAAGGLEQGLYVSADGGRTWRRRGPALGLLAWPAPDRLYLVDAAGTVLLSRDEGRSFAPRGELGGQAAALFAAGREELYAALHDGTIVRSANGGTTWAVRATP